MGMSVYMLDWRESNQEMEIGMNGSHSNNLINFFLFFIYIPISKENINILILKNSMLTLFWYSNFILLLILVTSRMHYKSNTTIPFFFPILARITSQIHPDILKRNTETTHARQSNPFQGAHLLRRLILRELISLDNLFFVPGLHDTAFNLYLPEVDSVDKTDLCTLS